MGLTSRKKRPLDRTIDHLRDTRLIIIASEGTKTEKQYFESELFGNRRVQVRVIPTQGGKSAPKHVLNRLKNFIKEYDLCDDDQLWLVIDKDRHDEEQLSNVCRQAANHRRMPCRICLSNPCFELWLYLHFVDCEPGKAISSREMEKMLRGKLGSYNKSRLDIEAYKNRVGCAASRAKAMDQNPQKRWPDNPGTHVYRLVEAIRELEFNA